METVADRDLHVTSIESIRDAARLEATAWSQWADDPETPHAPPKEYYDALEAWLREYDPIVLPIASQAMQRLLQAYQEYLGDPRTTTPHNEFKAARMQAQQDTYLEPPEPQLPPSPVELQASGVKPRQIGYMWCILTPDGQPDLERVQQELDKPGSVITQEHKDWMHQQRLVRMGFILPEGKDVKAALEWHPPAAPEPVRQPLENLIHQRLTVDQIIAIKNREYGTEGFSACRSLIHELAAVCGIELADNAQEAINEGGHELAEFVMGKDIANSPVHVPVQMPSDEPMVFTPPTVNGEGKPQDPSAINRDTVTQVMQLFSEGFDAREIGKRLGKSASVVRRIITSADQ